jgi:Predicted membrane protein
MATGSAHPVNRILIDEAPLGARVADRVTGFMGSWRFLIIQTVFVAIWLAANIFLLTSPFDPYPFILLNLAFSTQAAYAAPLILLAGNRASIRDRMTLEHAASEADVEEKQNGVCWAATPRSSRASPRSSSGSCRWSSRSWPR